MRRHAHLRQRFAALLALAALAACRDSTGSRVEEEPAFTAPIAGVPMEDVFYGAYLDHAPGEGVLDYQCGAKAYDGHGGVDVLLRNFRVQDDGVPVLATADGVVASVADGLPDRNTSWEVGGFGNHVVLSHPGGVVSIYGHLRRGSVAVAAGDRVERGAVLGLVGSSGRSNWPHLHFEVRRSGGVVDPFAGPCGPPRSLWAAQLPYQDGFMVTDAGLTDQPPTLAALLERPETLATVRAGASGVVFWLQLANQRAGVMRYELRSPDGAVVQEASHEVGASFSMRFLALSLSLPADAPGGVWEVRVFQDGALIWTQPFTVDPRPEAGAPSAGAAMRGAALEVEVLDEGPAGAASHR